MLNRSTGEKHWKNYLTACIFISAILTRSRTG
nr:MAG TPA: hypothetical protein [Caudoviricetes sp.]